MKNINNVFTSITDLTKKTESTKEEREAKAIETEKEKDKYKMFKGKDFRSWFLNRHMKLFREHCRGKEQNKNAEG
jgi:hypothetical protein